jgi:superfamily II DNA or RNA helicase
MQQGALVADTVDTWLRLADARPTLCYAVDRAHAKNLQQKFESKGVPCGYQDAFTKDNERKALKRAFHNGDVKVVCNVGTLTTGIDWDVRCISMCRPTKSDMLFVQIVGRGLRTAKGKDYCLILDHSDNHQRLGFVTDIDQSYTKLREGKAPQHENRTAGIRLPKECPKCAYLRSPKVSICPQCGFKAEMVSSTMHDEGELRELKRPPKPKAGDATYVPTTQEEKASFYAELRWYAQHKGYRDGWAANQYRERIGTWPANEMKHAVPVYPRASTLSWIKHRMIAYAKGKAKQNEVRP